ncbi:phospholipase D-like domain-containing protein [Reichenbachiella sp.]|uniref:phospholipase D-like domain-containing protein n=1 Tax=Reichenbachiella sp. TaxID=2184521 RepID=UPI0032999B90
MILNLRNELQQLLPKAKEVYIATALVKHSGFRFIEDKIPEGCHREYVVGIHLPTDPQVLQELMTLSQKGYLKARIYNSKKTYHPKVYILRVDDKLSAFIGSANTTDGGLSNNVEMSTRIDDQNQCNQLLDWFHAIYSEASNIEPEFLNKYTKFYNRNRKRNSGYRSDWNTLFKKDKNFNLQSFKDTHQFFKCQHFEAYQKAFWNNYGDQANERRRMVKARFLQLHRAIENRFVEFGLIELHKHYHTQNIVSSHVYRKNFTSKNLASMWLHYGFSEAELDGVSFLNRPRIQVILRPDHVGIWLVVGKDKGGGKQERKRFKELMTDSKAFRNLFYLHLKELDSYWIQPSSPVKEEKTVNIIDIKSASHLHSITQKDTLKDYFIIGREYRPDDKSISEKYIAEEILTQFSKLYPLFLALKGDA